MRLLDLGSAFPIVQTWLAKCSGAISGVWAANDDMALEALRAAGLAVKVPVVGVDGIPEAIAAVDRGEMLATVSSDAYYQGSIGLAMGLCVLSGQAPPPRTWSREQREFYLRLVAITKDNAGDYRKPPNLEAYAGERQCGRVRSRSTGPAD